MTSHRPYLLRALYEWIADNDMTPHLLVDASQPGVQVPAHTVRDGKVVLNIAARGRRVPGTRQRRRAFHRPLRWREPSGVGAGGGDARDLRAGNRAGHGLARRQRPNRRRWTSRQRRLPIRRQRTCAPATRRTSADRRVAARGRAIARKVPRLDESNKSSCELLIQPWASYCIGITPVPRNGPLKDTSRWPRSTSGRVAMPAILGILEAEAALKPSFPSSPRPQADSAGVDGVVQPLHGQPRGRHRGRLVGTFGRRTRRAPVGEGEGAHDHQQKYGRHAPNVRSARPSGELDFSHILHIRRANPLRQPSSR